MKPIIAYSFTADDCLGNPAAVIPYTGKITVRDMRQLATLLALPITCFVQLTKKPPYPLRWFTATTEISLCGHGTLATAAVLFRRNFTKSKRLRFSTKAGIVEATLDGEMIALDLPAADITECPVPTEILPAFSGLAPTQAAAAGEKVLLSVDTVAELLTLRPDFAPVPLSAWGQYRTLIVTAPGGIDADYSCRVFAPLKGLPEDSVTGSAQTLLAPYWGARLGLTRLRGWQASEAGGRFYAELLTEGRIRLSGRVRIE